MNRTASRLIAPLLAVAIVLAYWPSLDGSWIGSDRQIISGNLDFGHPWALLTQAVWHARGEPALEQYHPLSLLSFAPTQLLAPGALVERIVNLALHLGATLLVAGLAQDVIDGAQPERRGPLTYAAWFGAALFALHPAAADAVAWAGGRSELLPTVLTLLGWRALLRRKDPLAGVLIGLTPFCDETFLIVPVTALTWMWATGRLARRTLLLGWLGSGLYIGARRAVGLGPPAWGAMGDVPGELGAIAERLVAVLLNPLAVDAAPPFAPSPVAGTVLFVGAIIAFVLARRRPALAALVAPVVLLLPWAPAVARTDVVPDRMFYPVLAGVGAAAAWAVAQVGDRAWARAAWLLPLGLGLTTARRTPAWVDDESLYADSLARDPANPVAAWRLGRFLDTRTGDCHGAIPLYEKAHAKLPYALPALETCLFQTKAFEEAARLAAQDVALGHQDPVVLRIGARANIELDRPAAALPLAKALAEVQPEEPENAELVTRIQTALAVP